MVKYSFSKTTIYENCNISSFISVINLPGPTANQGSEAKRGFEWKRAVMSTKLQIGPETYDNGLGLQMQIAKCVPIKSISRGT